MGDRVGVWWLDFGCLGTAIVSRVTIRKLIESYSVHLGGFTVYIITYFLAKNLTPT